MDYLQLIADKSLLKGTLYYEFQPGPLEKGRVWSNHSVYLDERAMDLIAPAIERAFPDYHPYSFQELSREGGHAFADELAQLAAAIDNRDTLQIGKRLRSQPNRQLEDLLRNPAFCDSLASLARALSEWIVSTLRERSTIALLGL